MRVLIVDDEPLARRRIRDLLDTLEGVEIVGECRNGQQAAAALAESSPDLLLLDIQLPDMNGFEVLEKAAARRLPEVIFVTAFDRYAIQAFEVHALDYLLKPYDDQRFLEAVHRARIVIAAGRRTDIDPAALAGTYQGTDTRCTPRRRILVEGGGRTLLLDPMHILWVQAEGSYVRLHTRER